jgi:hypothetical protein
VLTGCQDANGQAAYGALNGLSAGRAARPLSGEDRSRQPMIGAVVDDPSVWTGRALQAENDDLENVGLALLYSAC